MDTDIHLRTIKLCQQTSNSTDGRECLTPLHASHEDDHAGDTKEASDEVDLSENLGLSLAFRIHSRRRMVEEDRQEEADAIPNTDDDTDISPRRVVLIWSA